MGGSCEVFSGEALLPVSTRSSGLEGAGGAAQPCQRWGFLKGLMTMLKGEGHDA